MIDDEIRAIRRRVLYDKLLFALIFTIFGGLYFLPFALLFIFKTGVIGRIALLVSMLLVIMLIVLLARRGEWLVRRSTGAVSVKPEQFSELESLSEDISIATGKPLPALMFIDDKRCCNLFSIKKSGHAVIFFGRGLLNRLSPDELRAAIAHEMAHIHNGDAKINTLTVTFRALYEMSLGYQPWLQRVFNVLKLMLLLAFAGLIAVVIALTSDAVFICLLSLLFPLMFIYFFDQYFSLFLPSILRNRDLYADELAVKWTLQPEALISALQTAQLHDKSKRIAFLEDITFVPTVMENPHKYLQSASVEKRIENVEEAVHIPVE